MTTKRTCAFVSILLIFVVGSVGIANSQTWTTLKNAPPVSVGAMLLLTDGRVLVHEEPNCSGSGCVKNSTGYGAWYTLTPDITGSYVNGTWTQVATLPSGYTPLFFASAVLPDGKVVIQGGEYNCPSSNCTGDWQSNGALYDPVANTWTATTPPVPSSGQYFGDAQSVVLPNGTWMVAACCAKVGGYTTYADYFYFNESSLNFTTEASVSDGETTEFDESGWNLLPNGDVLMVNVYLGAYSATAMGYALYNPSTNAWTEYTSTAEQLWDADCGNSSSASYELGPIMLMPNGTLFATGASKCAAGNIATYNWSTNTWTGQGTFTGTNTANDAPGATEINGNAMVVTSPRTGANGLTIYEWNGSALSTLPNVSRSSSDSSFVAHLLVLPTGQIMFTDFSTTVQLLTSSGTYQSAWQPTITTAPTTLTPGTTYSISGMQFNGVTTGAAYGDDFQDNTNYPLVQIVNTATGNVYYARTHGHSTMGVATGSELVSTNFDVPATVPNGSCELYVVANGIPSAPWACSVGTSLTSTTAVASSSNPSTFGQSVSFTAIVTGSGATPTGTVQFNVDGSAFGSPVALSSGSATSGSTSSLTVGGHTVTVVYSGDSNYSGSTGTLSGGQVVNKASQTITVTTPPPASAVYNAQFTVAATASSGLAVAFTSSGSCSNSGATYTMTSGTGTCSVIFNQAGNTSYSAAPTTTDTTNATPASQAITVTTPPPASAVYNAQFTVAATANSGLSVAFTSSGSCSNSGATYTMTSGTGTCSVIFNQAGNTNYSAAPTITDTTNATLASQTITFTTSAPASAAYNSQFTVAATGGASGNPVVFTSGGACSNSGATYTMTSGTGSCSVIANQSGNSNYASASQVTQTTNATLVGQTITFTTNAPASAAYGSQFTVAATGGASGNPVVFTSAGSCSNSGATYTMTSGTGSCSVIANQAGNSNYSAASQVTQTTNATLASQTITFTTPAPSSAAYGQSFTVAATGGASGNPVVFTSAGSCSNSGATYTMTSGTGSCSVIANQAGNSNYSAATQVTETTSATVATSSTGVGSSLNPSSYGQSVIFTATITGQYGLVKGRNGIKRPTVTGSVSWSDANGSMSCSEGNPSAVTSGTATCTVSNLAVNPADTITGNYSGDSNHTGSSGTVSQEIDAAGSNVSVGSSANPSNINQSVTFTATISGANGLLKRRDGAKRQDVTGTVTWSNNTGCGTTDVTSGNPGTATCTTSSLPSGTNTITAQYNGDTNHNPGTGTLSGGQVVNGLQSQTITFTMPAPSSAVYNSQFTVAATGGGSGNPVVFTSSGSCSNLGATYTMTSGTGVCSVIANQAGNSNYSPAPQVTEFNQRDAYFTEHHGHVRSGERGQEHQLHGGGQRQLQLGIDLYPFRKLQQLRRNLHHGRGDDRVHGDHEPAGEQQLRCGPAGHRNRNRKVGGGVRLSVHVDRRTSQRPVLVHVHGGHDVGL